MTLSRVTAAAIVGFAVIPDQPRMMPPVEALVVQQGAVLARKVQSGYLTSYALVMLLGLVAVVSWVLV